MTMLSLARFDEQLERPSPGLQVLVDFQFIGGEVRLAIFPVKQRQTVMRLIVQWIQADCLFEFSDGERWIFFPLISSGEREVSLHQVRLELYGVFERFNGRDHRGTSFAGQRDQGQTLQIRAGGARGMPRGKSFSEANQASPVFGVAIALSQSLPGGLEIRVEL